MKGSFLWGFFSGLFVILFIIVCITSKFPFLLICYQKVEKLSIDYDNHCTGVQIAGVECHIQTSLTEPVGLPNWTKQCCLYFTFIQGES